MKPEFTVYAKQVRSNCRTLAAALIEHGFSLATDGSDNHLILWNLRPQGAYFTYLLATSASTFPSLLPSLLTYLLCLLTLSSLGITGSKMQTVCDKVGITLNKNAIFGDRSAMTPGGVRIGTPAMTTRGLKVRFQLFNLCVSMTEYSYLIYVHNVFDYYVIVGDF